ncbi:MAG: serine hydrolase [Coriobacteriia bacterium]|nr:serine hydrolase [Coriobacteriia bacterium]
MSALIAFAFAFVVAPDVAHADIKTTDVIMGKTVEQSSFPNKDCPSIDAKHAIVIDSDGTVYFQRDSDEQVQIASVTKIMTALVALEYGDLNSNTVEISTKAAQIGESSAGLHAGDTMSLTSALEAMMINSGNDAAQSIAESLGSTVQERLKSKDGVNAEEVPTNGYDAFIYAMNLKARELGMDDAVFNNPHGLDFDQYKAEMHCSARDVYKMASAAMQYDTFRNIVKKTKATISVTRDGSKASVSLKSTDILLGGKSSCIGVKTGFTEKAGECFAGAWDWNGKTLYTIVLGSSSESSRFDDAKTLYEWVRDHQVDYPLAHASEKVECTLNGQTQKVPVVATVANKAWTDRTFKATIADPAQTVSVFALSGNVSQEASFNDVSGDVRVGDKVGTLTFYQHNKEIAHVDLVAAENCPGPGFIEGVGIFFSRIGSFFSGGATEAQSVLLNKTPLLYGN